MSAERTPVPARCAATGTVTGWRAPRATVTGSATRVTGAGRSCSPEGGLPITSDPWCPGGRACGRLEPGPHRTPLRLRGWCARPTIGP